MPEMAEHREERLRNRRVRDRARRADHTATETAEEREARLQATRDRRAAESSEARETRLQCMSSITSMRDWHLSHQRRERSGYNV